MTYTIIITETINGEVSITDYEDYNGEPLTFNTEAEALDYINQSVNPHLFYRKGKEL